VFDLVLSRVLSPTITENPAPTPWLPSLAHGLVEHQPLRDSRYQVFCYSRGLYVLVFCCMGLALTTRGATEQCAELISRRSWRLILTDYHRRRVKWKSRRRRNCLGRYVTSKSRLVWSYKVNGCRCMQRLRFLAILTSVE